MAVMERRLITGTTTLGLRYSMLNLEEGDGNVFLIMMRAVDQTLVLYMTYNRFCFGTRRRIADFTTSYSYS
jgi:hypothetical protein